MVAFPLFLHMIILYRDQQRSGNVFMEKRYRGYPPEVKKVPWMLYRREEQSAGPVLTGNELRSEMDYLRGLYPSAAKRKQVLAEEACDLLEYPGSPMYDEYPDRELKIDNCSAGLRTCCVDCNKARV